MAVEMKLTYDGELRCTLEHISSGSRITTDAPVDNSGRGEAFSPTDLVGAALLSCAITTMAIAAPKEGLPFSGADGRVTKIMTSEGPRQISRLEVQIDMPAGLEAPHRARLEEIARGCPVARSLSTEVAIPMSFRYSG